MTQKELAYIEDAIGHENNMIMIISNMLESLDDKKVISFLEKECRKHKELKECLLCKLEEKVNE